MISNEKCIGFEFYPDKVIQALLKELPIKWSKEFNMAYIKNSNKALDEVFKKFRGVAWINCNYFLPRSSFSRTTEEMDVSWFRKRKLAEDYKPCPENYLDKLELKRYANNTVRTYVSCFESFINHYKDLNVDHIN